MTEPLSRKTLLAKENGPQRPASDPQQTNAALAADEARSRLLSENLAVVIYSAVPDQGRSKFYLSGSLEKLTGYPSQRFLEDATLFAGIIHPEDRQRVDLSIGSALRQKQGQELEYRIVTRDGAVKWIRDRCAPVYSQGRLLRVDGIMEDITHNRHAQKANKNASRHLQTILNAMHEALMIMDPEFRVVQCNRAMCELLKRQEAQIIGRHCWELIQCTDRPSENCPCPPALQSRQRRTASLELNERFYKVTINPEFDQNGKINAFICLLSDITDHRRAESALREAHQTLLTVLDSIEATIYVADMQTHEILFMNRHMKEVYEGDFTGQTCWQALHGLKGPCESCIQDRLIKNKDKTHGLCIWERHDTISNHWYLNYDRIIKWVDGRQVRLQVATDITEIKTMEKERLHTEARLRQAQKMEAIGTLAGGIAHDFNNILSAILGYSELALDDALNNRVSENYLRQILKAGYRARELVQQILTFSRQTETEAKPIQVKPIVKEALKLLRASLPSTIDIQQSIESEALVEADPTQIHQVVINLCTNAGHAMREKGGVLKVGLTEAVLELDFTSHYQGMMPGAYLKLEVSDTGHGISAALIDKIFDPYFTTKQKGEGTGMGLAVVQGIVRSCGGTVAVASSPGQGAVFTVYLPVIQQEAVHRAELEGIVPGGHERILFVDDEPPLADLGKQLLERQGYSVTLCTSSREALALFESRPDDFDLVITDMTMPHMTGDVMARKMMAVRPGLPVVICTGYSQKVTQEMIERLGIRGFVMKPLVRNELALAVRQALDETD